MDAADSRTRGGNSVRPLSTFQTIALICVVHLLILAVYIVLAHRVAGFVRMTCEWDCQHYVFIAEHGYNFVPQLGPKGVIGQGDWAFFPLYPLLERLIAHLSGWNAMTAGSMLNLVLLPVLAWLLLFHARERVPGGVRDVPFFVLLFFLYPFGIWYRAEYSEALYGVLMVATLLMSQRQKLGNASIFGALLSATRPTGMVTIMVVALAESWSGRMRFQALCRALAFMAIACLGLSAYMLMLDSKIGDALAFKHIQVAFQRVPTNPFAAIYDALHWPGLRLLGWSGFFSIALMICGAVTGLWVEALILAGTFFLAASNSVISLHRIMLCSPWAILLLWRALALLPGWLRYSMLLPMAVAQYYFITRWFVSDSLLM